MSRTNERIVTSLYDAVQRRDYQSPFELLDEHIRWDMSGLGLPDLAGVYLGHEGIREFWRCWLAAWETLEFELVTVESRADHVIVEVHQRNRGRASGVALDFHYFQAFTVRNRKVTASYAADTLAKALEAVGLPAI